MCKRLGCSDIFFNCPNLSIYWGFPDGTSGKEPTCQHREERGSGSIPVLGRCLGEGNGNPLQYICLENPMNRGAWQATVHRIAKCQTGLKGLSNATLFPNVQCYMQI